MACAELIAAERRRLVMEFRKHILEYLTANKTRLEHATAQLRNATHRFSGGIEDDAEVQRDVEMAQRAYDREVCEQVMMERTWNIVMAVFGRDTVDFAIDEANQRIGELPYANK